MNTLLTRLLTWTGSLLLAVSAGAAYLEPGDTAQGRPEPRLEPPVRILPPPVVVPPPPRRDTENALTELVRRVEVGTPYSYRGLTVYPLNLRSRERLPDMYTLDEALSRRDLTIREKGDGQVPYVWVRNEARRPVFMMTGEILLGGKQNRVVRDDVLLPARSEFVDVPVYCGEQHRWEGGDLAFKASPSMSAPALREMAAKGASQDSIWKDIDGRLEQAEVRSGTRSYQAIYDDKEIRGRLDECVRKFRPCCTRVTVGCVVVCGDRILGADLFSQPDLFSRLWDKIVRSYASDYVVQPQYRGWDDARDRHWVPGVNRNDVTRFLERVRSAELNARATPGLGRLFGISGTVSGNVLLYEGDVVHAAIFPGGYVILQRPGRFEE